MSSMSAQYDGISNKRKCTADSDDVTMEDQAQTDGLKKRKLVTKKVLDFSRIYIEIAG